ncbi:MAG: ATP-binding cassette domain-containing protein [Lachnospiraceae bacterium]|nr:ATP-binding cassette domain-containing protein [Lachnospiraceae bacterium]
MAVIEIKDLSKTFIQKDSVVEALKNINFFVEKGDIYGIIGMSGAGKSTLVRCLNFLERPTSGTVLVQGKDLSTLSPAELRKLRCNMGMIFQNFNLLMQDNVLNNVTFPLTIHGTSAKAAKEKAMKLLETVGLSDKASAYPAQLSGGQKQRVAIARALACDPEILLCDEATSALDPQTTQQILALLKKINKETGITIIIITHSMNVVREICHNVAIVEKGEIVEDGLVEEIFTHPKSKAARRLIIEGKDPEEWERSESSSLARSVEQLKGGKRVRIVFSGTSSYDPVIANMVLAISAPVNILYAATKDVNGIARGEMILGLSEDPATADKQIAYLKEKGIAVTEIFHEESKGGV